MPRADIKMRSINISDILGHLSLLIYMFHIIYPLGCYMPLTKVFQMFWLMNPQNEATSPATPHYWMSSACDKFS